MTDNKQGCARLESEARIDGDRIVISLSVSTLAHAARESDYFWRAKEDGEPITITDEMVFAKSVCGALNCEAEDGGTPITRLLDDAFEHVVENGEDGIDYGDLHDD